MKVSVERKRPTLIAQNDGYYSVTQRLARKRAGATGRRRFGESFRRKTVRIQIFHAQWSRQNGRPSEECFMDELTKERCTACRRDSPCVTDARNSGAETSDT